MKLCFGCFCKYGIDSASIKHLAEACGMSGGNLFHYFASKDEIIIKSTAYCMETVVNDFTENAPRSAADLGQILREMPYRTAKEHGEEYRFMCQVYTSPKYRKYGKGFFENVRARHAQFSEILSANLGIPLQILQPPSDLFIRACAHYALFENKEMLQPQIAFIE